MKQLLRHISRSARPVLALTMLAAFCATAAATPDARRQGELVHLVRHDCGSCHGLTLKGGLGKPLLPENLADTPVEALVAIILDGVPNTPMPPWRGLLHEAEAEWIALRLKQGLPQ